MRSEPVEQGTFVNSTLKVVHCGRSAMATLFEAWLVGDDDEHLRVVGEAALDEVARVESLLSRFDRTSEVSRINRRAAREQVLVDREVFRVLRACQFWWEETGGYFDPAAVVVKESAGARPTFAEVVLDEQQRTVRFMGEALQLDLGALGKGYALECAADVIRRFGVNRAFLHGGTSSGIACGADPQERPWKIGVRDPAAGDSQAELCQVDIVDRSFSCSAALGNGQSTSDIIQPPLGRPVESQAACVVLSGSAVKAEALSTALLAMGKAAATAYTRKQMQPVAPTITQIGWIDQTDGRSQLAWLS
jgi:thiamine biosynthesis lipoprotein